MKDGSYSIEAALIMPGVLLLIITFLLLGFYFRDIVFTEAYGRSLLLDWESSIDKDSKELREGLKDCLWYSGIEDFYIKEYVDSIKIGYKLVPATDLIKISAENKITVEKDGKTAEKIQGWRVWIDEAKELFLTEDENGS